MKLSHTTEKIAKEHQFRDLSWDKFILLKLFLRNNGKIKIKINGVSMNPILNDGDIIFVETIESINNLKRFDILIFWQAEKLICHYFWRTNNHFFEKDNKLIYCTRPANPMSAFDHPISEDNILGIVRNPVISLFMKLRIIIKNF